MTASTRFRNHRGELVEAPAFSASDAKNSFGRILDAAVRTGMVTITRHDEPRAVLLSMDEYRALSEARASALDALTGEFDAMLARMQAPGARKAMQSAFDTPATELGRIADRITNGCFPGKSLQERELGVAYFLNGYGPEILEIIGSHIELEEFKHLVLGLP